MNTVVQEFAAGQKWLAAAEAQPDSDKAAGYAAIATAHFAACSAAAVMNRTPGLATVPPTTPNPFDLIGGRS